MSANPNIVELVRNKSTLVRPRFSPGLLLRDDDLRQGVDYTRDLSRLLFRSFFGCGVVCGLVVEPKLVCGKLIVTVNEGIALDGRGDPIYVPGATEVKIDPTCGAQIPPKMWVVLCRTEQCCAPRAAVCGCDDEDAASVCTREQDGFEIKLVKEKPKAAAVRARNCRCAILRHRHRHHRHPHPHRHRQLRRRIRRARCPAAGKRSSKRRRKLWRLPGSRSWGRRWRRSRSGHPPMRGSRRRRIRRSKGTSPRSIAGALHPATNATKTIIRAIAVASAAMRTASFSPPWPGLRESIPQPAPGSRKAAVGRPITAFAGSSDPY